MGLIDRLFGRNAVIPPPLGGIDNFWPWINLAGGGQYPLGLTQTLQGDSEEVHGNGAIALFAGNAVVFAVMATRMKLFSEARFRFRRLSGGKTGDLFGTPALDILEHPWPNASTGDLLTRAIQDADLWGNFYATRRAGVIYRMRPDWVKIILSSDGTELDAEIAGYAYYPGGEHSGHDPEYLLREQVCHFAPYPDPTARYKGMSWLTPLVREIAADSAATSHKLKFFQNGGTPNMIVKRLDTPSKDSFDTWVAMMRQGSEGLANAYKTLYLSAGADVTVVGKDFQQMDFKALQGVAETRIAAAGRVHPSVVGLSEGLQGASLNAGNFGAARRLVADGFLRPDWRNFASSMETLVPAPSGSQLWYDDSDIAFLREDRKDAAEIQHIKANTIRQYTDAGFTPETAVKAVEAEDPSLLKHSGLFSVQLQPPGTMAPTPTPDVPVKPEVPAP